MVHCESWFRMMLHSMAEWTWHNRTHRILIYISLVLTLMLVVELFDISLVGK
jgi:hypothetical protein